MTNLGQPVTPQFALTPAEMLEIHTTELEEGTLCWVLSSRLMYVLNKIAPFATPNGTSVLGPAAQGGVWKQLDSYVADPEFWAAPVPTTEQVALDRLAVAVAGLLGNPVP